MEVGRDVTWVAFLACRGTDRYRFWGKRMDGAAVSLFPQAFKAADIAISRYSRYENTIPYTPSVLPSSTPRSSYFANPAAKNEQSFRASNPLCCDGVELLAARVFAKAGRGEGKEIRG